MQTELRVKIDGEVKCLVKFSDFDGEPNHAWFTALNETLAGRQLPDGAFGKDAANDWVDLLRTQYPNGKIDVIRR